eukprot:COSAG02_NODE_11084_length_1796_cov_1.013553_2_plen_164_part_00
MQPTAAAEAGGSADKALAQRLQAAMGGGSPGRGVVFAPVARPGMPRLPPPKRTGAAAQPRQGSTPASAPSAPAAVTPSAPRAALPSAAKEGRSQARSEPLAAGEAQAPTVTLSEESLVRGDSESAPSSPPDDDAAVTKTLGAVGSVLTGKGGHRVAHRPAFPA